MKNRIISYFGLLLWFILGVACSPTTTTATTTMTATTVVTVPVVTTVPTDTIAVPSPSPSPSPTTCFGWMWAYGTAPDEFVQGVQAMMVTAQISGTVKATTFGENDGCGRYHAMSTDFAFTIPVPDPTDEATLSALAETVTQLAQTANQDENRPAPNLGNIEIAFENDSQRCYWRRSGVVGEWNKRCEAVTSS